MLLPKHEKESKERKKTAIILILQFLFENGYNEALSKLENEAALELEEYDLADNVDFLTILKDFEEYYQYKYDKKPVFVKKKINSISKKTNGQKKIPSQNLPSINRPGEQNNSKENSSKNGHLIEKNPTPKDSTPASLIMVQGKSVQSGNNEWQKDDNFLQPRILNGLPDTIKNSEELSSLARSLQKDIILKNPNVKFESIIGLENCKKIIKEAIFLPLKLADFFEKNLIDPWSGVLFFGSSGTGKTQIAKAVATECGTTFFNISASSIISKYHGPIKRGI